MITTEIITDVAVFREMRQEWNALLQASSSNSLFLTWEWMYTWWVHLSGNRLLHIIAIRQDGELIAIAPLMLCPSRYMRLMPFRVLEFIASGRVGSDYLSILVRNGREENALRGIANCLTEANLMLELIRIEKSSFPMVNLALQLKQHGWQSIRLTTNYSPFVKLTGHTWETYLDSINNSHKLSINKKIRKLYKTFDVKFELARTEQQRQESMDVFVKLHLNRWSGEGGSNALNQQQLLDFHQDLSKTIFKLDWLRLYTLFLDGKAAAAVYIFKYENVFYFYQTAYNIEFRNYAVGIIILAFAIQAAIDEGAVEFDFLHDDDEYKYLWAREERELIRLEFYPPKKIGMVYKHAVLVKGGIKRAMLNTSFFHL